MSDRRVLIIPAAGTGSRLKAALPKPLVPVNGRPMIDHLLDLYDAVVARVVLVVSPLAHDDIARHVGNRRTHIELVVQREPTGMLDAILLPLQTVGRTDAAEVWITWCDQVAVHPATVATLDRLSGRRDTGLVLPTCSGPDPYIHFVRDEGGRIVDVRQRREGDAMPAQGESDMGLFAMSASVYLETLPAWAREAASGAVTGERNFLPFVAWLGRQDAVATFACHDRMEAVGINTPEDLAAVADYLNARDRWPSLQ